MKRKDYMSESDKRAMGDTPRTHQECMARTKRSRPGKTAHDKARGVWMTKHERRQRNISRQEGNK